MQVLYRNAHTERVHVRVATILKLHTLKHGLRHHLQVSGQLLVGQRHTDAHGTAQRITSCTAAPYLP